MRISLVSGSIFTSRAGMIVPIDSRSKPTIGWEDTVAVVSDSP